MMWSTIGRTFKIPLRDQKAWITSTILDSLGSTRISHQGTQWNRITIHHALKSSPLSVRQTSQLKHLDRYSRCSSSFSESFGFGTRNQHTVVTTISDTKIGCRTHTPMLVLSRPVTIGKTEPPICAKTKTRDSAVDFVSDVNNREPTDMAWGLVSGC
jgi:hypothetical protein